MEDRAFRDSDPLCLVGQTNVRGGVVLIACEGSCSCWGVDQPSVSVNIITFTFMHLADAFIQSDLHCIQVTVSTFYQLLLSLGFPSSCFPFLGVANAMLYQLSYRKPISVDNGQTERKRQVACFRVCVYGNTVTVEGAR